MTKQPKRADGQKNRAAILEAAGRIFATHGFAVALDVVAKEAGVGRATLYRNFPSREDLALAVFAENVARLGDQSKALEGAPGACATFLEALAQDAAAHAGLGELFRDQPEHPDLAALLGQIIAMARVHVTAAQAAGTMRADLSDADLAQIIHMLASDTGRAPLDQRKAQAARRAALLLDGLRAK